mmetsp:Transcript_7661/g.27258  ORF Transcript_7661/g.27258 Transcript_7661/m.27258 type:complete len:320 (+) Transcript_7661:890-1849(+)
MRRRSGRSSSTPRTAGAAAGAAAAAGVHVLCQAQVVLVLDHDVGVGPHGVVVHVAGEVGGAALLVRRPERLVPPRQHGIDGDLHGVEVLRLGALGLRVEVERRAAVQRVAVLVAHRDERVDVRRADEVLDDLGRLVERRQRRHGVEPDEPVVVRMRQHEIVHHVVRLGRVGRDVGAARVELDAAALRDGLEEGRVRVDDDVVHQASLLERQRQLDRVLDHRLVAQHPHVLERQSVASLARGDHDDDLVGAGHVGPAHGGRLHDRHSAPGAAASRWLRHRPARRQYRDARDHARRHCVPTCHRHPTARRKAARRRRCARL